MLNGIEPEQPLVITVDHRAGRQHLGVQLRLARQRTMEDPTTAIGPIHHRRDG
jgi:hypothetical protein